MEHERENSDGDQPEDFLEQLLRGILGPQAAEEAARAMRDQGFSLSSLGSLASPQAMSQAMSQFKYLMSSSDDPVNWRMVEDISRQSAYQSGDPRLTASQAQRVRQALSIADLWLDPVTDFTAKAGEREAWTRVDWIDQTIPAWKDIFNPVALNVSRAMTDSLNSESNEDPEFGLPQGLDNLLGSLNQMMPKMAAMSFGAQVGQGLAAMAKESFGTSDAGFPLTASGISALVPTNIAAFSEGLDEDFETVQQYVATREMAHVRLFASVPWLRHDLNLALIRYSEEIAIDTDAIAEAARSIDPSNPESLNDAMAQGVFAVEPTESQERALARLEALLSLIEGWVEVVVTKAVAPYLPSADRLREMIRRRRVTGSPAENLLGELVGLQLRPRQARGAAAIFRKLELEGGDPARDGVWAHPDLVPTPHDLEDPENYRPGSITDPEDTSDFDRDLEALLAGTLGYSEDVPPENRGEDEDTSPES